MGEWVYEPTVLLNQLVNYSTSAIHLKSNPERFLKIRLTRGGYFGLVKKLDGYEWVSGYMKIQFYN